MIWVFSGVAGLFLSFGVIRSIFLDDSKIKDLSKLESTALNFIPIIEALIIVVTLSMALCKLHLYHKKFGLDANNTKLWYHFLICTLLLSIYIVDFGYA